ncbi:hypothetical protein FHX75_121306 [Micromonospora palomenae]|uniref:DUF5615 domain-containing protein n=1 Tax=Micromonospora palomenae TaxID=1461247 RepID=A0A561WFX9_9ACTN|nr:DUF5615 family PIN-like protein [Micromonospora palomenae]TWG22772.1 hypothetical protein FHX75_121306 [Micromonospora palomenae]
MTALLLDEMYPPALARQLRERGHDVLAALDLEVGLSSRSDEDALAWATRHQRCVVTENVRDFARLAPQMPHAGIILVSARRFPRTRSGLARLLDALDGVLATKSVPTPDSVAWLGSPE